MAGTLADRVAALDRRRFVGRARELARLEAALDGEEAPRVVLLHGPGGIGKSALVREIVRRAGSRGFTPRAVDGREILPAPGEIERALDGVGAEARPLVVLDSYERMSGVDGWLRQVLLPSLPAGALAILASRDPPAEGWFRDGWEHVTLELELGPLADGDATAMLAAYGLTNGVSAGELVRWARGWPLALSVAASRGANGDAPAGGNPRRRADMLRAVVVRLTGDELAPGGDAVAVAAMVRSCDAALLRRILPDLDADAAMAGLRELSFAERVGDRVTFHDLVRRALRAEFEARDPARARDLRRRLADDVHARAVAGEPRLLVDLTELIDDRALRWGLGAEGSHEYRIDGVHPGDTEALSGWYRGRPRWWRDVAAFLSEAPGRVVLARDASERLTGISIAITLADPPALVERDVLLGRWLEHSRAHVGDGNVLLWRDATDFAHNADPASPVVSLMNTAVILQCGLANVRYSYLPIDPANRAARRFSHSVNGREVPELGVEIDGRPLQCHVVDHGEGGMIGQLREVVYAELRLPAGPGRPGPDASFEDVRDALRNLHRPTALARSALATGPTAEARAASVRALVTGAIIQAFGESAEENLLREVLERGYVDPDSTHEQAAGRLHLSRTAYYRRLNQATRRLAEWLLAPGARA